MSNGRSRSLLCVLVLAMGVLVLGATCQGAIVNRLVPKEDVLADWDNPLPPNVHWARVDDFNGTSGLDMITTKKHTWYPLAPDVDIYKTTLASGADISTAEKARLVVVMRYPVPQGSEECYIAAEGRSGDGYPWLHGFKLLGSTGLTWVSLTLDTIDNLEENDSVADWRLTVSGLTGVEGSYLLVDELRIEYYNP